MPIEFKMTGKFTVIFFFAIVAAAFLGVVSGQYFNHLKAEKARAKVLAENPPISLKAGDLIPNYSFVNLDGTAQGLYQQLGYDKGIILVMSSSCGFCAQEVEKWKGEFATLPAGVKMIGIANDPVGKMSKYCLEKSVSFPILCDSTGKFFEQNQVKSYPIVLLVGQDKRISKLHFGFDPKRRVSDYLKTLAMN